MSILWRVGMVFSVALFTMVGFLGGVRQKSSGIQWVAFLQTDAFTQVSDLYLMEDDGSERQLIATDVRRNSLQWSPDGKTLLFETRHRDIGVCLWKMAGATTHCLRSEAQGFRHYQNPVWSPDGKHLAAVVHLDRGHILGILNRDGSNFQPLGESNYAYTWSPDSSAFVYAAYDPTSNQTLLSRHTLGQSRPEVLSHYTGQLPFDNLHFSPNGQWLFFSPFYVSRADGSEMQPVTYNLPDAPFLDVGFGWTPDNQLLFTDANRASLYLSDPQTANLRRIMTEQVGYILSATSSPDGNWILFTAADDQAQGKTYRIHPDGTGLQRLDSPQHVYLSDLTWTRSATLTWRTYPLAVASGGLLIAFIGLAGWHLRKQASAS